MQSKLVCFYLWMLSKLTSANVQGIRGLLLDNLQDAKQEKPGGLMVM